jgi:WD40 repeat protein
MRLLQTYQRDSLVTEMTFETFDPNLLAATGNDGSLTLYDIRQQQQQHPVLEMKNMLRPEEEALSLSMGFGGNIAAVGSSKGKIHFFDIREKRGILGTYSQNHTDEITRVRFQTVHSSSSSMTGSSSAASRSATPLLVSASEDGLACVFDTSQPTEESALSNILSVQSPIREVGFFGPNSEAIYCLTGSESLQLYDKDNAVCRKDFGPQLREYLTYQLQENLSVPEPSLTPAVISPIEYLVDCHWDHARQELLLLAGSSMGDAGLFQVGGERLSPIHYLHGGHRGVIRAWDSSFSTSFLTVGEDARMCEWSRFQSNPLSGMQANGAASAVTAVNGPQIILPSRKRQGAPIVHGGGGGKLRRPRSRLTTSPY